MVIFKLLAVPRILHSQNHLLLLLKQHPCCSIRTILSTLSSLVLAYFLSILHPNFQIQCRQFSIFMFSIFMIIITTTLSVSVNITRLICSLGCWVDGFHGLESLYLSWGTYSLLSHLGRCRNVEALERFFVLV